MSFKFPDPLETLSKTINEDPAFGGSSSTVSAKNNPFIGKIFYCWDTNKLHRDQCCFNHMIGLPRKKGKIYPLFEFQKEMIDAIELYQHLWIKKARGIGATELYSRIFLYKCVSSEELAGKNIFIISGTREEFANKIKVRMENLLIPVEDPNYKYLITKSKYTETTIYKTWIKVFPTKAMKDMRGDVDVAYLFVDEADFFDKKEQDELPYVALAYEEKSNAKIIMVSTPNKPDGLFASIEKQSEEECTYKRLFMGYEKGLNTIYDPIWIAKEKVKDPTFFEREYNLKYMGGIGNVFSAQMVNIALELGDQFKDWKEYEDTLYHVGVDPGFGSSNTAIVITQWIAEYKLIKVIFAEEYERANPNAIVDQCFRIMEKHPNAYFWVDRSNAGFVTELKTQFNEPLDWHKEDPEYFNPDNMRILPVNFGTEHKQMLADLYQKFNRPMVAVPRQFVKLEIGLRSAQAKEYSLDKDETSYDDLIDALRLAVRGYRNV